jgi:hypothetical protein
MLNHQYTLGNRLILPSDYVKDIDGKLYFYHHTDFLFLHAVESLGLICTITFPFQP